MTWSFKDTVHCAAVGRDLVILDLGSDAYFCIPDAGAFGHATVQVEDLASDVLESLIEAELVRSGPAPTLRQSPPSAATSDLRDAVVTSLRPIDGIRAVKALGALRLAGDGCPVSRLLALAAPQASSSSDPDLVLQAAGRFASMLPWLPVRNQCLHRSALLMLYLRSEGFTANWIFGVRTWPFRAHCWVQIDNVCLSDDSERLRAYTPILSQ